MWNFPSFQLLSGSLCPGVVVPVRVALMGQIKLFLSVCKYMADINLNSNTRNYLTVFKQIINIKLNFSCLIAILETI